LSIRRHWQSFDFILLILVCAAAVFGIMMIGAAASYTTRGIVINAYTNQRLFIATGIIILIIFTVVDYHFIGQFYWLIYALMVILLIAVLIVGQEDSSNTARWFRIGNSFSIQPSEFSKVFMIVFLAKFIDKYKDSINNIGILSILAILVILPVVLIERQPALSASVLIAFISICVIFSSGLKSRYILITLAVIVPIVCFFVWDWNGERAIVNEIFSPYQITRIETFLEPEDGTAPFYQSRASLRAIGSGMCRSEEAISKADIYLWARMTLSLRQ
jgi:rod shape determining protein RodA